MIDVRAFYRSTIGKKVVMAVSGVVLVGFVMGHVAGNLLVYAGAETFNHYSAAIKANPVLLWGVRSILVVAFVLHLVAAYSIKRLDRAARPEAYAAGQRYGAATLAGRTMGWGGLLILVFVMFHLAELTLGVVHPSFSHTDVYGNVTRYFQIGWVVAFYTVAMVALTGHLYHGTWSMLQTVGIQHPRLERPRRVIATLVAMVVPLGFVSIPILIYFGVVG